MTVYRASVFGLVAVVVGVLAVYISAMAALEGDREVPSGGDASSEVYQDAQRLGPSRTVYWLPGIEVKFATNESRAGAGRFEIVEQEIDGGPGHSLVNIVTDFKQPLADISCCVGGDLIGTWHRPHGEVVRVYLLVDGHVPGLRATVADSLAPVSR